MKKYLLLISSILLAGCLKTETRNPFPRKDQNKHDASPVSTDVAVVSTCAPSATAACASCDANLRRVVDLEAELSELRWLLDEGDGFEYDPLSEPF